MCPIWLPSHCGRSVTEEEISWTQVLKFLKKRRLAPAKIMPCSLLEKLVLVNWKYIKVLPGIFAGQTSIISSSNKVLKKIFSLISDNPFKNYYEDVLLGSAADFKICLCQKQCYRKLTICIQPLGIKFKCEFKTKDKRLTMPKSNRFLSCTKQLERKHF